MNSKTKRVSNETVLSASALIRFWAKVRERQSGCWVWIGGKDSNGYGIFNQGYTQGRTHRWSLRIHGILFVPGLVVDHMCGNRACVRPQHLRQVTLAENTVTGSRSNANKTHCRQGHPYSPENTYHFPHGGRQCRECRRISARAHYAANREHCVLEARKRRAIKRSPRSLSCKNMPECQAQ